MPGRSAAVLACRIIIKARIKLINVQTAARSLVIIDGKKAVLSPVEQIWLRELLLPTIELGFGFHHLDKCAVVLERLVEEAGAAIP